MFQITLTFKNDSFKKFSFNRSTNAVYGSNLVIYLYIYEVRYMCNKRAK